jgi:hypothetical protein
MMLPRAWPHPFPATRRATLVVMALLALHVVLALVAVQAHSHSSSWRGASSPAGRTDRCWSRICISSDAARGAGGHLVVTAVAFVGWVGRAQELAALGDTGARPL